MLNRAGARQSGATMMEVLVAIIIVIIGLLGLAGLQARMNAAEMESFQRAQALVLLQDIVDRMNANRKNAASYITATPLGTGTASADCSALHDAPLDLCEWNNSLLGATESTGGLKAGAMIGARGCVQQTVGPAMPQTYLVSVVWQGLTPTVAPGSACGAGLYDAADKTRRAVTATVMIGCLENNALTGVCITTPSPPPVR